MILSELLACGVEDSIIAEGQTRLNSAALQIISEAKITVASFDYEKSHNDPTPKVMVLGRWKHPTSGNFLICGINIHYLDKEQNAALQDALPEILSKDSLKAKYWEGMSLIPDIFKTAYRTYDERFIHSVTKNDIEVADHVPEPKQQELEPLPEPIQKPERAPAAPPPTDIGDVTSKPSEPEGPLPDPVLPDLDSPKVDQALEPKPELKKPEVKEPEVKEPAPTEVSAPAKIEPPQKKPEHKSLMSRARGLITKLAGMVKNKLSRNKGTSVKSDKSTEKSPEELAKYVNVEVPSIEPDKKEKVKEVEKLDEIERHAKALGHDKLDPSENSLDDGPEDDLIEGFEEDLNTILEQYDVQPRGTWKTPAEYIKYHTPENFFEYQTGLGTTVLECAHGTQFLAIHHIPTDTMIIDLANSHLDMLCEAKWELTDTVRFSVDNGQIYVAHNNTNVQPIVESILKSDFGQLLQEIR